MREQRPVRVLELRSVRGTGGGPEKTILLSAAMADPRSTRVTVCYLRDRRDSIFAIHERAAQAHIDYVEVPERHSFDPQAWATLRRLVHERQIDLLHAHDYKTDLLALLLSRATGVRALATVHGWTGHSTRERFCYYPADKRLLARFPRLIAVSSDIARELVEHGADPTRVTTVLNAIDHRQFRRDPAKVAEARTALGLQPHHVALGAVGRLEPQKRFDLLLEAFAVLQTKRPDLRLFIVGDGGLRQTLERQCAALGLAQCVTLTGHVSDVRPLHHAFDLFVQSSDYEGTPNAVLEAMAMETPVVATQAGGTAELVHDGEHGRVVPTGMVERLIWAIEAALADPAATRTMADRARQRVEGELSFESRVRRVEGIYQEVMGPLPARRLHHA
ncbi:MAG TPA: glycosyltransferase [Vicinamibacterales bacterium]|nr:glycosyltransferase [Vicinamibacterales bacterium]